MSRHKRIGPAFKSDLGCVMDARSRNVEPNELGQLFASCEKSAFRLQTLPEYAIDDEQEEFNRFLGGLPFPDVENDSWLNTIRQKILGGIQLCNVHILPAHLTPYLRFAIDWSYVYRHLAGEQIRFILSTDAEGYSPPLDKDFWLFDEKTVVEMNYDPAGRIQGAARIIAETELATFVAIREIALQRSFDLPHLLAQRRRGLIK